MAKYIAGGSGGGGGGPTGPAGGDLAGNYPDPEVVAVQEASGPTRLEFGVITPGQLVQRQGSNLAGLSPDALFYVQGLTAGGAVDNTTVLQTAINAAITFGGRILLIPPGVYKTGPLNINGSGVVLRGSGTEVTTLLWDSVGGPLITFSTASVERQAFGLLDLTLKGTLGGGGEGVGELVRVRRSRHAMVQRVRFENFQIGLQIFDNTRDAHIEDCVFWSSSGAATDETGVVIRTTSQDNFISGCWFRGCSTGIDIGTVGNCDRTQILNNIISLTTNYPIRIRRGAATVIVGNRLDGSDLLIETTGSATLVGNDIDVGSLVLGANSNSVLVQGNRENFGIYQVSRTLVDDGVPVPSLEGREIALDTEGGDPTDDLYTLSEVLPGKIYILRTLDNARDITIKNLVPGTGNIRTIGGVDRALSNVNSRWIGYCSDGVVYELAYYS